MHVVAEILAGLIRDLPGITRAGVIPTYTTHDEFGTHYNNLINFSNGYYSGCIEIFEDYCSCWNHVRDVHELHYYGDPTFPDSVLAIVGKWAVIQRYTKTSNKQQ